MFPIIIASGRHSLLDDCDLPSFILSSVVGGTSRPLMPILLRYSFAGAMTYLDREGNIKVYLSEPADITVLPSDR